MAEGGSSPPAGNATAPDQTLLIRGAPVLFVLLWATGFLMAKFAIPYAEPFTILVIRFALASAMMACVAIIFGARWPRSLGEAGHIAMTGVLLQAVYLGGCYAAIYAGLAAGVVALIAGLQPVVTAALSGPLLGEHLKPLQWLGAVLGFVGLSMVIWHKLSFDPDHLWALAFAFVQLFGITAATFYQKRFCPRADLKSGAAIQYAAATLVLLPVMLWLGVGEIDWQAEFIFAMGWIVIVLSGISIALLTWMLQRGAAARVASLFYLTPPVAALGGFLLFGETLDALAIAGMGVVALGVALVNRR
ncbi:drug/metabolite transporter (DMT)-like permease [Dongia mobilis]|uniref:Drug/metabolite transporter (DMT)-like permease n=1 Tax=Dongia mobilis TaxID=578943 RepID=A0A4R6WKH7_9PROT|nr:DMT family transporter [Dongia mobilis]TDQ81036.1 drug/metabolite transporter (DMT)-like permease [Dongia mobilis]